MSGIWEKMPKSLHKILRGCIQIFGTLKLFPPPLLENIVNPEENYMGKNKIVG